MVPVLVLAALTLGSGAGWSGASGQGAGSGVLAPGRTGFEIAGPERDLGTQKRIYIANDEHTDYFWTATDVEYRTAFQTMLDYYMDQADATAANPSDTRGRFNCDGSLWAWEYEQSRSAADFERLMDHVRNGTISLPLQTCVMLYGAMPAEAVLRNMYYAGRLERREGLRFPLVVATENQTLPGGVASLWAGSGARYSWRGICNCATRASVANRPREIYNFRGRDGQSVCMKWNSWQSATGIGGYAEARDPAAAVEYLEHDPGFLSRWPWPVSGAFGYGADFFVSTTDAFVNAATDLSTASRRVIVSNEQDFFEDFLAHHASEIPTFSGSFGNEWDLYTASMGEVTADFKRHVEKLRTAEALATVASLHDSTFMNGREPARDRAFLACGLFYEHDWTADGVVPRDVRAQFQRDQRDIFAGYVDRLESDGLARIGELIPAPEGVERHVVFNPLGWTRDDFADLAVQQPWPVHVVDVSTGAEVPCELLPSSAGTVVRVLASGVPSVGYRVYEVRPGAGASFTPAATVTGSSLDNGLYGVVLDPNGSITSLIDHHHANAELVDATNAGAINALGSGVGTVTLEHSGPVSATLRAVVDGQPTHETRVTLYRDLDRVDIEGLVTQNFGDNQSYRSSFALPGAQVHHEEVGMIARAARAADGGDYADQNTRTDYLTFNHFVDLSQPLHGVTVSNWDSPFFALGSSTVGTLDESPSIRAVVGIQVDGPSLGIPNQGGDTRFLDRFALQGHGIYEPWMSMRFALGHQNQLTSTRVTGGAGAPLPRDQWSLLSIEGNALLLWALKPAEEGIGHGIIARVWNVSENRLPLALTLPPFGISSAQRTTHIETDIERAASVGGILTDDLERQQMRTYRLVPGSTPPRGPRDSVRIGIEVFPNPASQQSTTRITYTLTTASRVRVSIHDLGGGVLHRAPDHTDAPGAHVFEWDGLDRHGNRVRPGVYFVRIEASGETAVRRLVRL